MSVALLIAVSAVAGASAQTDAGEDTDTLVTPVAKDTTAWLRVGGADFNVEKFPENSPTPVEVDLYDVAFDTQFHGFAVGAGCKQPPPAGTAGQALTDYLNGCDRQPVIYEYTKTATEETWHEVLPSKGDGYVGGVAFMPDGRALAVGGTGKYPKREPSAIEADPTLAGRAWLYEDGFWRELTAAEMPAGIRGMTAVAMSSDPATECADAPSECGLAGGYRQMWLWKNGEFATGWDAAPEADRSPDADGVLDDPESFRFRVRAIEFAHNVDTQAVAVTSGCCDAVAAVNVPAALVFDGTALYAKEYSAPASVPGADPAYRRDIPDSFYDLTTSVASGQLSVVASPGGSSDMYAAEQSGRVFGTINIPQPTGTFAKAPLDTPNDLPRQAVSTMRLTAGAGTFDATGSTTFTDWAVGSIASGQGIAYYADGDAGLNAVQGGIQVLSCTDGSVGSQSAGPLAEELLAQRAPDLLGCQPYDSGGYTDQTKSKTLFQLPTYSLNSMEFTDDTESIAWAVGDRGAIVRLGGIGTTSGAGGEPETPKLGAATTARLSGSDVYDAFRPLPIEGDTAPVPSLASNGATTLEQPEFVPGGSPNPTIPLELAYPPEDVNDVVMSPDGSEGWAVGAENNLMNSFPRTDPAPTLYHYDGLRWARCDILGTAGLLPADPACASLAELFGNGGDAGMKNVVLRYAVRIPVENDDDPGNDDDFEVFAIGTRHKDYSNTRLPLRYRNGRWEVDEVARDAFQSFGNTLLKLRSIAFTAPDDGWAIAGNGAQLVHWDGTQWWNCGSGAADSAAVIAVRHEHCGDPGDALPLGEPGGTLAVAGRRVYLAANIGSRTSTLTTFPAIRYKDPDGNWTSENGGYNPDQADTSRQGSIVSLAVSPDQSTGWAVGRFGATTPEYAVNDFTSNTPQRVTGSPLYYLLHLQDGVWSPYVVDDAARDYLSRDGAALRRFRAVIVDPATGVAALHALDTEPNGPGVLLFDPTRGESARWRVLQTPFHASAAEDGDSAALVRSFAPDGEGGAWLAATQYRTSTDERVAAHFWHYTDQKPNEVFEEAPHPIRERITGSAAGKDGSFWVTTNSGFVYRYDRLTGWDRLRVPGWDRGRFVTRSSPANAVAVAPDGKEGMVVGEGGRMAEVSPMGVKLDPAAAKRCGEPPCSTGRDLRAVDVAPDGSALAGGDASVLLYRPQGEEFRRINFGGSENASITAISMPSANTAWVADNLGQVYGGVRTGPTEWRFSLENVAGGKLLSRDEKDALLGLHGIDIDPNGEGYAVGDRGLLLERRGDGGWQRLKTGFLDTLRSVTLAPRGRDQGALIGGDMGLILTLEDGEFRVAREADLFNPVNYGQGPSDSARVRGVAMVPGTEAGELEAWAVQQGEDGPGTVLHYASNPDNVLLRPGGRIDPLPDAPLPRDGEISFAAFGRSECHGGRNDKCPEGSAGNLFNEVVSRRVTKEVIDRSREPGGPDFVVFTGDVGRAAGRELGGGIAGSNTSLDKSWVHERWEEQVADRLADAGVPLFGAVGLADLDRTQACISASTCSPPELRQRAGLGPTWGWRRAFADMPAPWGTPTEDGPLNASGYSFNAVADPQGQGREDPVVGQARTHYAIDLKRGSTNVARLIFLDNSMGTLNSSDPNQNPIDPDGQLQWLERMLADARANRLQTIVAMNRPTYSYQVSDATTWATDGTVLEQTLLKYGVKMVVSGRLGWNGRYWATAPGLHSPCPGGAYREDDAYPKPGERPCSDQTDELTKQVDEASQQLADALQGVGPPPAPGQGEVPLPDPGILPETGLQGLIPMVVASSAGGRFGPSGTDGGEAGNGWWHGYTLVRMAQDGHPEETIVEQRPVFDWVSITAPSHVLKPRQHMNLIGEGREPIGVDVAPRYDRVNSYAITHRYDLVMADKANPSLPARDANGDYIPVSDKDPECETIGCINRETGAVSAKSGRHERVFTVAILSVGDKVASWPIVFEPAKSFKATVAQVPPAPANQAPQPPATVVLNQGPAPAPPPPPPAQLPQINVPQINMPAPPAPPQLPIPTAAPTPTPPPPPAPPPPPGNAGALPLSLEAPIAPVSIVPTVIPPTPPPVNPAPPSGGAARKEAKQRQAATAKSEEGGGEQGAAEGESSGDNGAAQMTRRDPSRPAPSYGESSRDDKRYSFTALAHSDQPSAWSRGALYGGMTLAMALALALGWGIARPTPRRRHPPRPAPQTVRDVGRRPRS